MSTHKNRLAEITEATDQLASLIGRASPTLEALLEDAQTAIDTIYECLEAAEEAIDEMAPTSEDDE